MAETFNKKKALGQNFLTSDKIPTRIAEVCGIDEDCGVIEIGPGMGILTKQLALRAAKVVAIEIDEELIPILEERFSAADNVKIINKDVLKCDLGSIIKEEFDGMDCAVCANLPYYITTPIIMALLEGNYGFRAITVMIQKEVAERLCAPAGSPNYGAVTAAVNYYASVKKQFNVGAANFSPKPKVDSAVITITPYKDKPVKPQNEKLFFGVLKAAFATRRKTLVNSLSTAFNKISKGDIQSIVSVHHSPTVRGEELSVAELAQISDEINKLIYTTEERK